MKRLFLLLALLGVGVVTAAPVPAAPLAAACYTDPTTGGHSCDGQLPPFCEAGYYSYTHHGYVSSSMFDHGHPYFPGC